MAFNNQPDQTGTFQYQDHNGFESEPGPAPQSPQPAQFDIFAWYPCLRSCHEYFIDHAQHSNAVQALAAFLNIRLPYQNPDNVVSASSLPLSFPGVPNGRPHPRAFPNDIREGNPFAISLIPYLRRLIATGFDRPDVLHGFFGDNWLEGVGPLHETERRNYLFAAKSSNWLEVKTAYDLSPTETIPFLKPIQRVTEKEIDAADVQWSEWLAMQDWMVGPRAPDAMAGTSRTNEPHIKREPRD